MPANETVQGLSDGKLTGVTDLMEYQKQNADGTTWPDTWTAVPTGATTVTDLAPGVYHVRCKEYVADDGATYLRSEPTADITITAGVAPTYKISVVDVTINAKYGEIPVTPIVITNDKDAGANAPATIGVDDVYLQGTNRDMFIKGGIGGIVPMDGSLETLTISPNGVLDVNTYTADIYVSNDDGASYTAKVTLIVSKADPFVMPPQVSTQGTNSITVSGTYGQKYLVRLASEGAPAASDSACDTASVNTGNALVLDGLQSGTAYTVYTIVPESTNYNPSTVEKADTFTLPEAPSADSVKNETNGITLDYAAETVTVRGTTYEVYVPSTPSTTTPVGTVTTTSGDGASASISGAIPNAGASGNLYVRQKAAGSIPASAWAAVPLTARPAAPAGEELPAAPGSGDVTDTSITIAVKNGYEYILDTNASAPTVLDWAGIGSPYHKANADGTHTFSDLTAGTTYYVHVRKAATGGVDKAPSSIPATTDPITTKQTQNAPAAPTVSGQTTSSITLSGTANARQYIVLPKGTTPSSADWDDASKTKSGNGGALTFTGLASGAGYTAYARMAASSSYNASPASPGTDTYTLPEAPSAAGVVNDTDGITLDYGSETVKINGNNYEVYVPTSATTNAPAAGVPATISNDKENVQLYRAIPISPANGNIYVRVKANGDIPASAWTAVPLAQRPATPAGSEIPAAPSRNDVTDTTVTISVQQGYSYLLVYESGATADATYLWSNNGSYFSCTDSATTHTFRYLTPNTPYTLFVCKTAVDGVAPASLSSAGVNVKTKASATTPDAPAFQSSTTDSITVNGVQGQMYIALPASEPAPTAAAAGWVKAAGSGALPLSKLASGTEYKVYTYIPGDDDNMTSNVSAGTAAYTAAKTPSADEARGAVTLDYTTETVAVTGDRYKVFVPGTPTTGACAETTATTLGGSGKASISAVIPTSPASGNLYVRVKANGSVPASAWTAVPLAARPVAPVTPAAPPRDNVTDNSVHIPNADGDSEYIVVPKTTPATIPTEEQWKNNGQSGTSALDFTKDSNGDPLEPGKDYQVIVRKKATATAPASPNSDPVDVKTKNTQTTPVTPTADSVTPGKDNVTVKNSVPGQQYIVLPTGETPNEADWANAKTGDGNDLVFSPLDAGKAYTVHTRKTGTDELMPSPASGVNTGTKPVNPTPDEAKKALTLDYESNKATFADPYEVYVPSDGKTPPTADTPANTTSGANDNIKPALDGNEKVYVRKKANGGVPASDWVEVKLPAASHAISVSPATKDFGSEITGYTAAPAAQTFTVTNNGNRSVTSIALTTSTADYTVSAPSSTTIAPGGTTTFTVSPKAGLAAGDHKAVITITTVPAQSTAVSVSVKFKVIDAVNMPVTVSPSPNITQGSAPDNETITVGHGIAALTTAHFVSLTVDGKPVAQGVDTYEVVDGGSIDVKFKKAYLDTLTVGDHPVVITLTGAPYAGNYQTTLTVKAANTNAGGSTGAGSNPNTDDTNNPVAWVALAVISGAGALALGVVCIKKRKATKTK